MRRPPAAVLVLAPLLVALLYAGAHAFLAPRPTLENVVPRAAVLTLRFRGVEALDEHWPFERPGEGRVSEAVAALRNVPGLPGVDRSGPIHLVYLPRAARADPSLAIFPLSDADAFRKRFEGRDQSEDDPRGLERHAQHLEIRGDWAALAWDREIVRHLGEGGITCEDRGEDLAIAIDVPRMAEFALGGGAQPPWRTIVEALGAEPTKFVAKTDPQTGARSLDFAAGRVGIVAAGWRTARFWAWKQRREVCIELEPADDRLTELLASATKVPRGPEIRPAPPDGLAWTVLFGIDGRKAVARALHLLGVPSVETLFYGDHASKDARILHAWALANSTEGHSWTIVLESLGGEFPWPESVLPTLPPIHGVLDLPAGAAPLTVSDTRWSGPSPPAKVLRRMATRPASGQPLDGYAVEHLIIGADAERVAGGLGTTTDWRPPLAWPQDPKFGFGFADLAQFGLSAQRVHDVLGTVVAPGGLLSVLGGGTLEGDLATDGRILRLRIRVAAR